MPFLRENIFSVGTVTEPFNFTILRQMFRAGGQGFRNASHNPMPPQFICCVKLPASGVILADSP